MRLRFDPDQPWQLAAIAAVVDTFAGQPPRPGAAGRNTLHLSDRDLLVNLRAVQAREGLEVDEALRERSLGIEMETGTGKTYVMLRTLYELHARYGWRHAVLVVPTVAIREGLLASARTLGPHLAGLYGDPPVQLQRWSSARPDRVRRFARDPGLQLLVVNIDALNKDSNLLHRPHDSLGGRAPAAWLAECRPVVVLDEPQRMEGERTRAGLEALQPLVTLRYSATHRDPRHLVYRLDPVRAAELGLVKQVEVLAVEEVGGAPVEVISVRTGARGPSARVRVERAGRDGPRPEVRTVRPGADLRALTRREAYAGLVVRDIDVRRAAVLLEDGSERTVADGDRDRARRLRAQVHAAVREHLDRELSHREHLGPGRLKVLTLFFVDRVAAYAQDDGRVRAWFLEAWRRATAEPRYAPLAPFPDEDAVHAGWFARRRGRAVDTRGRSRADEEAYDLILRDKERLLDPAEPLRFLFTHSALREGWDNPNVFVVCTLATTHSAMRKRQEIGRGLRLPVLSDGHRCLDPAVNRLTVVTNASYEGFCRALQREHREAWGDAPPSLVRRHGQPADDDARVRLTALGSRLRWSLHLGAAWREDATRRLERAPPIRAGVRLTRGAVSPTGRATGARVRQAHPVEPADADHASLDELAASLASRTRLRRSDCRAILVDAGRLADAAIDADALLDRAEQCIRDALRAAVGPCIACHRGDDGTWLARPCEPPEEADFRALSTPVAIPSPVGPLRISGLAEAPDRTWMRLRG